MRLTLALVERELLRLARQPARIVASVATAGLMWAFLAGGASKVQGLSSGPGADASFAAFLVPGMASMVVVMSSMFAGISLIEDRREGVLRALLAGPGRRAEIVLGKLLGCAIVAAGQGTLLLPLAWLTGSRPSALAWLGASVGLWLTALGVTGVSLAFASCARSIQGFHAVMNLVLMPLWLLSGSVFPVESMAAWMAWITRADPLYWSSACVRASLDATGAGPAAWAATIAFAVGGGLAALALMARPARGSEA